jgi:hypothetical protein
MEKGELNATSQSGGVVGSGWKDQAWARESQARAKKEKERPRMCKLEARAGAGQE